MASKHEAARPTPISSEPDDRAPSGPWSRLRTATSGVRELNILLALLFLCALLAWRSPVFFTTDNLLGVARAFSLTAIAAIGQTMVIITGGIDLSAGSIIGLSSLSTGMLLASGWPSVPAILIGLLIGTAFGACNGLLITRIGLPPFIATLGTLSIGRGLIYVITKGYPVTAPRDELLLQIGQGYLGRVPMPVIIMVVVTILATIFLSRSTLGRYIYAVGGNEEAARLAGINVNRVKMFVYTMSGFLASVSGIILLSRLVSAQPTAGLGQELPDHRRLDHRWHQPCRGRGHRARRGPWRRHRRRTRERHRAPRHQHLCPAGRHRSGHPARGWA